MVSEISTSNGTRFFLLMFYTVLLTKTFLMYLSFIAGHSVPPKPSKIANALPLVKILKCPQKILQLAVKAFSVAFLWVVTAVNHPLLLAGWHQPVLLLVVITLILELERLAFHTHLNHVHTTFRHHPSTPSAHPLNTQHHSVQKHVQKINMALNILMISIKDHNHILTLVLQRFKLH
jgi:hypothetical protein